MLERWRKLARLIKQDVMTVYLIARDPRTPAHVKALALLVAAYALSPIDLIPDFIPVLGFLDDIILLPLGIALIIKLTPSDVLQSNRAKALELDAKPSSRAAAAVIVLLWILCGLFLGAWMLSG